MNEIISKIHPNDKMFAGNEEAYFEIGKNALKIIKKALFVADKKSEDVKTVLDMASGYGRVTRHLSAYFKDSKISVCDINDEAIDFCRNSFNTNSIESKNNFTVDFEEKFDLVWCGSLLTHLDQEGIDQVFRFFDNILNKNGILICTTHGRHAVKKISNNEKFPGYENESLMSIIEEYNNTGFGFLNTGKNRRYGISICSPSYILKRIEEKNNWRNLIYYEKAWGDLQDAFAIIKI